MTVINTDPAARDDEPIFTLLGRDPCAPGAITQWAHLRRNRAFRLLYAGSAELQDELRKCAEAEAIAFSMEAYRTGVDETPSTESQPYSGDSVEQRNHNQQIADCVVSLREAAFHTNNALERLAALGIDSLAIHRANDKPGIPVFGLADALDTIHDADKAIAPKRTGTLPYPSRWPAVSRAIGDDRRTVCLELGDFV